MGRIDEAVKKAEMEKIIREMSKTFHRIIESLKRVTTGLSSLQELMFLLNKTVRGEEEELTHKK